MHINEEVLAGTWMQIKGHPKERRGELVHEELDRIMGQLQVQVALLRERRAILAARVKRAVRPGGRRPGTA